MSALRAAADDYLQLRRALGYKLEEAARLLPCFVDYLDAIDAETVTIDNALAWAQQPAASPTTTVLARRISAARGFARHLAGIDPRAEVPPPGLVAWGRHRRVPFIYSTDDIAALRRQARLTIASPLRTATVDTALGLLAASGMRVGEVIALDRGDIDWSEGVLSVRRSKFGKARQVPLHPSTVQALAEYAQTRDRLLPSPRASSFFISTVGTRLGYSYMGKTFRKLVERSGIAAGSAVRPRMHDLRHTFCVRTLIGWYRDGVDVQARLPWLATYVGHRQPALHVLVPHRRPGTAR